MDDSVTFKEMNGAQTEHVIAMCSKGGAARAQVIQEGWLSARTNYGATMLMICAFRRDVVGAKALLEAGSNPNDQDNNGNAALHFAVLYDQVEIARALIDAGIDIDAQNSEGTTALLSALTARSMKVVYSLLERGADPCLKDRYGVNAFDVRLKDLNVLGDAWLGALAQAEAKKLSQTVKVPDDSKKHKPTRM